MHWHESSHNSHKMLTNVIVMSIHEVDIIRSTNRSIDRSRVSLPIKRIDCNLYTWWYSFISNVPQIFIVILFVRLKWSIVELHGVGYACACVRVQSSQWAFHSYHRLGDNSMCSRAQHVTSMCWSKSVSTKPIDFINDSMDFVGAIINS